MALRKGTASITNETNLVAQDITDIKEALSIDTIEAEQIIQDAAIALNTLKRTYPLVDEQKLATIASGAEVNVNADWNAVSGDAQILNKPTVPTVAGSNGQVQVNIAGAFGASANLTFVGGVLQVTGIGTGTNKTLRLLNASAVETFSVADNGLTSILTQVTASSTSDSGVIIGGTYTIGAGVAASGTTSTVLIAPSIVSAMATARPVAVNIAPVWSGTRHSNTALFISNTGVSPTTDGINTSIAIKNTGASQNAIYISMGDGASSKGLYIASTVEPIYVESVTDGGTGIRMNVSAYVNFTPFRSFQSKAGTIGSPIILEARNTTAANSSVYKAILITNTSAGATGVAAGVNAGVGIDFNIGIVGGASRIASITANAPNQTTLPNVVDLNLHYCNSSGVTTVGATLSGANGNLGIGTQTPTSKLQVVGLTAYADNAAAVTAGLTAGAMYIRTGHGLDIVV